MLDRETKRRVKEKANELADLNLTDMKQYASEYKRIYESGEFTCGECFIIVRLVDLYIAVKQGLIDKNEGIARQKQIFDVIELEV